ncbi:hypothetical protein ACQVP2_24360 [Methylobacterium aquaticum]
MSLHHHLVHLAVIAAYLAITVLHLAEGALAHAGCTLAIALAYVALAVLA